MKLADILTEASQIEGYWETKTSGETRQWIPVFTSTPPTGALFPFTYIQNRPRTDSLVQNFQAFHILPGRTRKSLSPEEANLFSGLEDALKLRSTTDKISIRDFQILEERAVALLTTKSGIRKQNPKRVFITTPPSSSPVAEDFARALQHKLNVPDEQSFYGHFSKRDAVDVIDDIEANVPEGDDKAGVLARISRNYAKREDLTMKIKDLWQGHRNTLTKAGISIFDVVKEFDLAANTIPYLLIVDDNVQYGSTADSIAKAFIKSTGIRPSNILSLAMFKYP